MIAYWRVAGAPISIQAERVPSENMSLRRLTAARPLLCRSPAVKPDVAWARSVPAIRPQHSIAASVENQRLQRPHRIMLQSDDLADHDLMVAAIIPRVDITLEANEPGWEQRHSCHPWDDNDIVPLVASGRCELGR